MTLYNSIEETIGNTPLIKLALIGEELTLLDGSKAKAHANLYAKVEFYNPAGSVKDRIAKSIIDAAINSGALKPGGIIIEGTSGNTGIALACVAASKGYKAVICMPESMSLERRAIIEAYGATLVLTPKGEGMKGAVAKAEEIHADTENSIIASQFDNSANPVIHYKTTGPEIYKDLNGNLDILVAGFGTGGTISGAGKFLKEKNPSIRLYAVEPEESPLITAGKAGPHAIQGIGANFIPKNLDQSIIDRFFTSSGDAAIKAAKLLARNFGISAGISSGAAYNIALSLAVNPDNQNKTIAVILPDAAERYLSTPLFA